MTAEAKWEYVRGDNPWARAYRCTTCGFVSELETLRHECDICAAITAAVEEREKELIPLVCEFYCGGKDRSVYRCDGGLDDGKWFHPVYQEDHDYCPASPLHEAIHQRDRKLREGNG